MSDALPDEEQGIDFDKDLARLEQIRRAHRSARPSTANPAWQNCHHDCAFLLGFIDSLWGAYTREGRKSDALLALAKEYASACINCGGLGCTYKQGEQFTQEASSFTSDPCDECAHIREAIREAGGK